VSAAGTSGAWRASPVGVHRRYRVWPAGWWFDLVMLAVFGAITLALVTGHLLALDTATVRWNDTHRTAATWWTGYALSCLGQGGPLTYGSAGVGAVLAVRRRVVWPVLLPVAAFALTYLVIGPIKLWSQRAAPHKGSVRMFAHPGVAEGSGMAYPSGHVANSVVWWAVLALLLAPYLPRWMYWALRVAMPATVAVTMVYTDYHWLTDVAAAIPLGLVLSRLLHRVPWYTLRLPARRRPFPRHPSTPTRPVVHPAAAVPAATGQPTGRHRAPSAPDAVDAGGGRVVLLDRDR
jgi:membrane-associated phospholipid phosphatase